LGDGETTKNSIRKGGRAKKTKKELGQVKIQLEPFHEKKQKIGGKLEY